MEREIGPETKRRYTAKQFRDVLSIGGEDKDFLLYELGMNDNFRIKLAGLKLVAEVRDLVEGGVGLLGERYALRSFSVNSQLVHGVKVPARDLTLNHLEEPIAAWIYDGPVMQDHDIPLHPRLGVNYRDGTIIESHRSSHIPFTRRNTFAIRRDVVVDIFDYLIGRGIDPVVSGEFYPKTNERSNGSWRYEAFFSKS